MPRTFNNTVTVIHPTFKPWENKNYDWCWIPARLTQYKVGGSGYLCFFLNFGSFCLQQCKQCVQGCGTRLVICEQKKRKPKCHFPSSAYKRAVMEHNGMFKTLKSSLSGFQDQDDAYNVTQHVLCEVCAVPKLPDLSLRYSNAPATKPNLMHRFLCRQLQLNCRSMLQHSGVSDTRLHSP